MEVLSGGGSGDVRAKWKSVTAALRSMQANLAELERQLAETLAMVDGELRLGTDTEVLEAVASTGSGKPSIAAEDIDELAVTRAPEVAASTTADTAPVKSDLIAPEEATNESLSEPQILFATQSPTIATEGLAEQKASSFAATPIEECGDMTAGHDQHTPPAECEGPNTCTPAEVKNAAAVTNLEITSGAVTPFMLSEAEAMSTQSESKELRTDGDSTKLDAQADVESTVVTTKVQAPLNSAAAVIGSEVAAVPAQPKNNVVCFSGRRRRLLRPLAASAAACLALWAGLILTNPDALATLASLGRVASAR